MMQCIVFFSTHTHNAIEAIKTVVARYQRRRMEKMQQLTIHYIGFEVRKLEPSLYTTFKWDLGWLQSNEIPLANVLFPLEYTRQGPFEFSHPDLNFDFANAASYYNGIWFYGPRQLGSTERLPVQLIGPLRRIPPAVAFRDGDVQVREIEEQQPDRLYEPIVLFRDLRNRRTVKRVLLVGASALVVGACSVVLYKYLKK